MTTIDYGTDVMALDDLPDPEVLVSGELNVAYAMVRGIIEPSTAHLEIGDPEPPRTVNIKDYLAKRMNQADVQTAEVQVERSAIDDDRVKSASSTVTQTGEKLTVTIAAQGQNGPFTAVATIDHAGAVLALQAGNT